ncbi:MAG: hypothetical protein HZC45_09510 [Deltaproteobacteria bacterium]|nr:hypothetical protein [Deltaproteobacteria bacterium]
MKGLLRTLIASFITLLFVSTAYAGPLEKITKTIASEAISEALGIPPVVGVVKTVVEQLSPKEQINNAVKMEVMKKMAEHLESTGKLGSLKISKSQFILYMLTQMPLSESITNAMLGGRLDEVTKDTLERFSKVPPDELNAIERLYQKWANVQLGLEEISTGIKGMINDTRDLTVEATKEGYIVTERKMVGLGHQITIEKIETSKSPSDASKLSYRNAQQQLTPTKVEFRQEYDLLFTQSADSLGSRYGSHSGTITDGTRFNISGDSGAGDFTGSFSGRTIAEPGYTPTTHNNTLGSGTSVGTVSAKGFKEGDLKGNMTITIPAGTQAVNVSGNITISKDGSLSMPSYSGPVTDNATNTKVGTMTGSLSQSKTTP